MRKFLKLIMLCYALLIVYNIAKAQNQEAPAAYVPGELIVKFKADNTSAKANHLATKMQAQVVKRMPDLALELWELDKANAKFNVKELVEQYKDHPDIDFIEPNYLYSTSKIEQVDDTEFSKQWGLHNELESNESKRDADIDAPEGWEIQSGSPSIVVGILDTGIDWRHPDLIDNIWQNLGEDSDSDGVVIQYDIVNEKWIFDPDDIDTIDNDNNGYVDDLIGWNFVDDNNQPFDYKAVEDGKYVQAHGTHVAGIIGATGNNGKGISGVSQQVQLAPLKFLTDDEKSQGTAWNAVAAIEYAVKMGMPISNNSWGGGINSSSIRKAIKAAGNSNHLFVAAAGNGGWDKIGDNTLHYYPSNYNLDNIISVANTNQFDQLNSSSNYSVYHVDVAAPGTAIYSCMSHKLNDAEGTYNYLSGTSMAAPMVAGASALLWEKNIELFGAGKAALIKNSIIENVDELPQLKNKVLSKGRLNIHNALLAVQDTQYTNQYTKCRARDSVALRAIHELLDLDSTEYSWHNNNSPMHEWNGIVLNTLGCVTKLDIRHTKKQAIPAIIGQLSDLTFLSLGTSFTLYPSYISNRMKEQTIDDLLISYEAHIANMVDNNLSLTIPLEIFNLKKLKHLSLEDNNISGSIPKEIDQLENLEYLNLSHNHLTGSLPLEIFNLKKLHYLHLAFNKLSGAIPAEIDQLENLYGLQLVYNELSGTIPISLGNISDLRNVDLGYNNLTGEIPKLPKFLKPYSGLYNLYLDNNQLSGTLDPALSWLYSNIEYVGGFDVSHNKLEGCYDPAFSKMGYKWHDISRSPFKNYHISDGNDFVVNWEEFATSGDGSCWASVTTTVWPGDMNNDGVVDVNDFVFYEAAVGKEGSSRTVGADALVNTNIENNNASTWEGKLSVDWNTNVLGVNSKHQDANGDGIVNELDYEVIVANRGLENPNHIITNPLTFYDNGVELQLKIDELESVVSPLDVKKTTTKVTFVVYLKDINDETGTVHNLAAKVAFNDAVEIISNEFIVDDCLDVTKSNIVVDESKTKFEIRYKKFENVDDGANCSEALARIIVIVVEELPGNGDQFLKFKVEESINSLNGTSINSTIASNNFTTLGIDGGSDLLVQLSTKPERCEEGGSAIAEVSGGTSPYTYQWTAEESEAWNSESAAAIEGLTSGAYTLTITDAANSKQEIKFDIEDDLIYDEEGFPLNCETYIETDIEVYCPENLNLVDVIPQETYNAADYIYTNGEILEDKEVELRAGDYIQLEPGFKMENNTFLDIKLEECDEE